MKTHVAEVTRDGSWWMVEVVGVGLTQARRLAEVDRMARELIAVTTDTPIDSFDLNVAMSDIGAITAYRLLNLRHQREAIAKMGEDNSRETRDVAAGLIAAGISMRDVGEILGVSHQRVHQLVNG